jgi:LmbE family N-acetylglucosaminyl deacetylase
MLRLVEENPAVEVCWVVFSGEARREAEARQSAAAFLKGTATSQVMTHGFRDGFFPFQGEAVKAAFEELKRTVSPDVIFTHFRDDLHQDHRLINQLTWNTWRNHLILEYEIPKWDGDLGRPNWFVGLNEPGCRRKIEALMTYFPSQRDKPWFTDETFRAMLRLRGVEAGERYAEGFYARKAVL